MLASEKKAAQVTLGVTLVIFSFICAVLWLQHKPNTSTQSVNSISINQDARNKNQTSINQQVSTKLSTKHLDTATVIQEGNTLYIDADIKLYFEQFLLKADTATHAQILALFEQATQQRYDKPIANYLTDLFSRYLKYLDEIHTATSQEDKAWAQNQYFEEAEIKALFGRHIQETYKNNVAQNKFQQLQTAKKYSPESLDAVRTELYGAEALSRFKQLDEERAQWQARLEDYQCEKQSYAQMAGLSGNDAQQQISQLKARHFSAIEQKRVSSLEQAGLLPENHC